MKFHYSIVQSLTVEEYLALMFLVDNMRNLKDTKHYSMQEKNTDLMHSLILLNNQNRKSILDHFVIMLQLHNNQHKYLNIRRKVEIEFYIQWRREEVKAGGGCFENGRKCEIFPKPGENFS